MKRKLIVRFRNQEDLSIIGNKLNLNLTQLTKEVDIDNNELKEKKSSVKIGMKNTEWKSEWKDMPEFNVDFKDETYSKIDFYFESNDDNVKIIEGIFEQAITDRTMSMWYPKLQVGRHRNLRIIGGDNPKYPIYVISKGRYIYKSWHTSFRLIQMNIKHFLVVEPQEYELYSNSFNNEYVEVIKMDMTYKDTYDSFSDLGNINSTGAGAVRNFCWDHSISMGYKWHWVMDDNIDGFNRFWRGHRLLCRTGESFRSCERFIERYDNIAIAGLNYSKFCKDGDRVPPYVLNTRIYSMLLIRNDIPYRWRGRYNEDTDLSLRVLKDNWCTVQFNLFLGEKLTTQKKAGGNTEEFYSKEGTIPKSQMLVDMHPDISKLVWKFNRWHHHVDYSSFTQELKLKKGVLFNSTSNEYNMKIVRIPRDICNTENDNREYIEANFDNDSYRVDNTSLFL